MEDRNSVYDYESENEKLENNCEKVKDGNEVKVDFDGCINNMIIKPTVNVTTDIEGLETSMFVAERSEEMLDKSLEYDNDHEDNELVECLETHDSVNCIIIKPVVKMDINISGLNTQVSQ